MTSLRNLGSWLVLVSPLLLGSTLGCVAITPDGTRALFTGAGASGKLHVVKLP